MRHPGVDARERGIETARDPRLETMRGLHTYSDSGDEFSIKGMETARNPALDTMRGYELGMET